MATPEGERKRSHRTISTDGLIQDGAISDTVVDAVAEVSTPAGLTTLATTVETVGAQALAKSIGLAKVGIDGAIFFGSAIACYVKY